MLFDVKTLVGQHDGPHLLITAGVHGDEWEPMVAVRELAESIQLDELRGRLTLIPILNVPAYRLGQRLGDDGLDLARVCPGRDNGSTTERIAFEFAKVLREADYYVDLHTGGIALRIWPLAGYLLHPNPHILDQQRRLARVFGLPVVWGTDPAVEGRTISAARDLSIPAIYVEYLGSATFNRGAVTALVAGCRAVMSALDMLSAGADPPAVRYIGEDPRRGSGHLQVCHPAPVDGLFEPVIELGAKVTAGQLLGFLIDDESHRPTAVSADAEGRLLAVRSLPRVHSGEALAVVAEFQEIA